MLTTVKDAAASRIWYGDKTFWLLDAHDCDKYVKLDFQSTWKTCDAKALRPLPGMSSLNGLAWGGITKEDMIIR
jgi:hypothetical protein